jgi:hypothetical protein
MAPLNASSQNKFAKQIYVDKNSVSNMQDEPMTDQLPDRLSIHTNSPFHNATLLESGVGIRFNGVEKTNVEEYCVSEGWVRVAAGTAKDRFGNSMTIKLKGKVEPFFKGNE